MAKNKILIMQKLKSFYIRTYGCQMNELDSEIMEAQLLKRGLSEVLSEKEADLIIYNTCSIRDLSERKIFGKLGILGRGKKKKIIGIAGCIAMAKKEIILKKFPHVDFLIGTNNISDLNKILNNIEKKHTQVAKLDTRYEKELEYMFIKRKNPIKASVSIIKGCNNFCTYCVVPHTRGREVSRSAESIVQECKQLIEDGHKEIILLGQNVNSYGKELNNKMLFPDLLYELDKIDGQKRIRFMTSHPKDITKDLMYAIKDLESVCEFVHFPFQAGSNNILKKMNRKYTIEEYLEKIQLLKEIVKNASIGTDVIVGFPTETEKDFEQTLEVFKQVKFDLAFIFAYSERKLTAASKLFKDDIDVKIKNTRLQKLMSLYQNILKEKYTKLIGTTQEVLVERENKNSAFLKGRTRFFDKVIFKADASLIGTFQNIKIKKFKHQTLIGQI